MKYKILIISLLIFIVGLSGCTEQPKEIATAQNLYRCPSGEIVSDQELCPNNHGNSTETNQENQNLENTNNQENEEVQDCPNLSTLPVEFEEKDQVYNDIDYTQYVKEPSQTTFDGWEFDYKKHESSTIGAAVFYCHKGKDKGENLNYHYCGQTPGLFGSNLLKLTKTSTNEEGVITKVKEIAPTIVYKIKNKNEFQYIETIC